MEQCKDSVTKTSGEVTAIGRFRDLCTNRTVFDFARKIITESYAECAADSEHVMRRLLDRVFDVLAAGCKNPLVFEADVKMIAEGILRTRDPDSWFGRTYRHYKEDAKPGMRYEGLRTCINGDSVLDFGCGDGLTSLALQQHGLRCVLTDVLDYRHARARQLPFHGMTGSMKLPFPDRSFDTALVMAVLHHMPADDLRRVLAELRRISRRVIVEEDSFDVPAGILPCGTASAQDAWMDEFRSLTVEDQRRYLAFLDYFGNAVVQGIPMDMPFEFKSVRDWQQLFEESGFNVSHTILKGFQPGYYNRTCHVWFILET